MCLAIPAKVLEIRDEKAVVDFGGVKREAWITLVDNVKVGDYLIIHTGYAIQRLDKKEAEETLRLFKEFESFEGQTGEKREIYPDF
ncbi:MAG: HypC/HybG/HupF family hydrogenase formation chaperone [Candidatus Jordarchaeum sp.]|uniref:HypC/HybG/HupF family hydrogenase formation chaperone n=1 Tax=Candidatus Jordarchaeum sp. TaxID=2823881 RepID=UPI00404B9B6F